MKYSLLFFLVSIAVLGCTRSEREEATLKQFGEGQPVKEAFKVRFVFSENAVVQAELEAPHAIESKENGQETRIFDKGMHLIFYTQDGVKESDLTAKQGTFKNQFNDAKVWGDVLMINSRGDRLSCDTLYWNKTKNRIRAIPRIISLDDPQDSTVQARPQWPAISAFYMPDLFSSLRQAYSLDSRLGGEANPTYPDQLWRDAPVQTPKIRQVGRPVMITTANEVIYGDSLDANTDFTEYKIHKIHGSLNVKEEEM